MREHKLLIHSVLSAEDERLFEVWLELEDDARLAESFGMVADAARCREKAEAYAQKRRLLNAAMMWFIPDWDAEMLDEG